MPQNDTAKPAGSRPGVMGDETEEQNLGQPGDPSARITREEVEDAFGGEAEEEDEEGEGDPPKTY
jgi:hypothetical protein